MSSVQQGTCSNDLGCGRANKPDKTRRSWSTKEEEVLIVQLKELVAQGWKSDNGFKAGYLNKLEDAMKKEFPGTDIKGSPHINSKISIWKKNYYSLSAMLSRSGVGFNANGSHMIDCTNEQWDQIVKCDGNARLMRYKPWPMLDDWREVFGKDRATGDNAEDLMDAVNNMYRSENNAQRHMNSDDVAQADRNADYHVNVDEAVEHEGAVDSVCQSQKGEAVGKRSGKKRKRDDELAGVYELLDEISRNTDKRLENLANRIGYEFDLGKARKDVYEQLGSIPGLSMDDKFDVCETLAREVAILEIIMGLPAEARERYVMRILSSKGK